MHLKSGDPKPQLKPGNYTLFGFRFCPFVERVQLVLEYYKIKFDSVQISLHSKPEWYLEMCPTGKVPLLVTKEGNTMIESDVIMRYLDGMAGNKSLLALCGEAEFERAGALISKMSIPYYRILYSTDFNEDVANDYRKACQEINDAIKGPYFSGKKLTLADFLLLPHLNRFEPVMARLDGVAPKDVVDLKPTDQNGQKWPQLAMFLETMRRLPFVAAVREPANVQALYALTFRQGLPNPDL